MRCSAPRSRSWAGSSPTPAAEVDAGDILLWLAGSLLVLSALQALGRLREDHGQQLLLVVAIALAGGATWRVAPDWTGFVLAGLVGLFLILPAMAMQRAAFAWRHHRWRVARAWLAVAGAVLLLPHQRDQRGRLRVLIDIASGVRDPAIAWEASWGGGDADPVRLFRLAFLGDWPAVAAALPEGGAGLDPALLALRLKASYETGNPLAGLRAYAQLERLTWPEAQRWLRAARVQILVAAGEEEAIAGVAEPLEQDQETLALQQASARWARGEEAAARRDLTVLAASSLPAVRRAATYRLEHPPPPRSSLPEEWLALARAIAQDQRLRPTRRVHAWMVRTLLAVNIAMYALCLLLAVRRGQALGGTPSPEALDQVYDAVLTQLGALPVPLPREQAWRLLTSLFLHGGLLHLALNMWGLWMLGRVGEALLGSWRLLALLLLSGLGGNVVFLVCARLLHPELETTLIGFSGALMGLVGMLIAHALLGIRAGATGARPLLQVVLLQVGLQVLFDWSHPEVASAAHLGGLGVGVVVGFALLRSARRAQGRELRAGR